MISRQKLHPLLLAAALLLPAARAAADGDDNGVQRYLIHLHLGMSLRQVKKEYAPSQDWPSYVDPKTKINRVRVERAYLKQPLPKIETMWFGFKHGDLVEIQVIYDKDYSRVKTAEALAVDWSTIYGEPHRTQDGRYWWGDWSTVLHVFNAEVPVPQSKDEAVELHTSVQLLNKNLFDRGE